MYLLLNYYTIQFEMNILLMSKYIASIYQFEFMLNKLRMITSKLIIFSKDTIILLNFIMDFVMGIPSIFVLELLELIKN